MKLIFSLLLISVLNPSVGFAQTEKKLINGHEFKFVTVSADSPIEKEFLEIFRADIKILRHTLSETDGDCSSENIELGTYDINNFTITFYTYWASGDRQMINQLPFGFRKQIYEVDNNGKIKMKISALYLETYVDDLVRHKGLKYLKTIPQTSAEIKLRNDYVLKVEKMYSGKFVFGKEKNLLEREVRKKLAKIIAEKTKNWHDYFGENCTF